MKPTRVVLALALTTAVLMPTGASANNIDETLPGIEGSTFFGASHADNLDFTDKFTFAFASPVVASAGLVTIGSGAQNIDFVAATLNGNPFILSPNGFIETGAIGDLGLTGPLVLIVMGRSGAAGGTLASYSGTLNAQIVPAAAVPEPSTNILLLTGLGVIGLMVRRQRAGTRRHFVW
jgi:hypothetical protein